MLQKLIVSREEAIKPLKSVYGLRLVWYPMRKLFEFRFGPHQNVKSPLDSC